MSRWTTLITQDFLPPRARALIWDTFFSQRHRGVNLNYHFPWLDFAGYFSITLEHWVGGEKKLCAAAVVRKVETESVGCVGLVGLVCVDLNYRGLGLSTRLMREVEKAARQHSLVALLLWTTTPRVYSKSGYVVDEVDVCAEVTKLLRPSPGLFCEELSLVIENVSGCGVPPFAIEVRKFISTSSSLTACISTHYWSVASWTGNSEQFSYLAERILPDRWIINTRQGCDITGDLVDFGYSVRFLPGAKRMVRNLGLSTHCAIPYFPLTQRI